MNTPDFILTTLSNRSNAQEASYETKNNRYHYFLTFDQSIGWDWVYGQMMKANNELETDVEMWEIHPGFGTFDIEVREVRRRANIDNNQRGLTDFE